MNSGMKPSVFYNLDPTYEEPKMNLNRELKGYAANLKHFLRKFGAAGSILTL